MYVSHQVIARGPGITGVGLKLGKPAEFEIDASKAGESGRDKVQVEVMGPEGPVKVDLTSNGDLTYTGAYYPEDDGEYHVKVTLLNCPVPKSPFKIGIYGAQKTDVNKVKVEGPGITGEGILPVTLLHSPSPTRKPVVASPRSRCSDPITSR